MSLPTVSIVTPCLNGDRFLEQAILSVIDQDYDLIEYIVMDGGSSDDSVDIMKHHENDIAFWISEADAGQSDAINRGWQKSKGDILAWLNSDDLYISGAISKIVETFQKNPKVEVITADCQLIDASNEKIKELPSSNLRLEALLSGNSFPQPGVFCRRSTIEKVGWLRDDLSYVFDWALWLRLWLSGATFLYLPNTVARFRLTSSSKTGSATIGGELSGGIPFARERCKVLESYVAENVSTLLNDKQIYLKRAWLSNLLELAFLYFFHDDMFQCDQYLTELKENISHCGLISPYHESVAKHFAVIGRDSEFLLKNFIGFLRPYDIEQLTEKWFRELRSEILLVQAWEASQRDELAKATQLFLRASKENPELLLQRRALSPTIKHLLHSTITSHYRR